MIDVAAMQVVNITPIARNAIQIAKPVPMAFILSEQRVRGKEILPKKRAVDVWMRGVG
jgi:hypothetical protein